MDVDKLNIGDKIYYPSVNGMALLCQIVEKSEKDVMVQIEGRKFYLPKDIVRDHAILLDHERANAFVTQRIEDPDNQIVYLRYLWNETLIDRAYNSYCRRKGRIEGPLSIPSKTQTPVVKQDAGLPEIG